jgi:hypothetical protein
MPSESVSDPDLLERKRKRLEAWRQKQQQQQQQPVMVPPPPPPPRPSVKISLKLGTKNFNSKKNTKTLLSTNLLSVENPLAEESDKNPNASVDTQKEQQQQEQTLPPNKKRRKKRWDDETTSATTTENVANADTATAKDALESFMEQLEAGVVGPIVTAQDLIIDVNASNLRSNNQTSVMMNAAAASAHLQPYYQPSDWLSDATATDNEEDEEKEQEARRALIEALKQQQQPATTTEELNQPPLKAILTTRTEVKSAHKRRQQQIAQLQMAAEKAKKEQAASLSNIGQRLDDTTAAEEEGVVEEAERNLQFAQATEPDALEVLADLNKKKELVVDHSKIQYPKFQKNLYRVPRKLANLSNDDVVDRRAKLHIRLRGHGAPAPVSDFAETGLSEILLQTLADRGITKPFPVQAQCIPCILAGRDVIGIAKTGSGKTLAYVLPMLRHISVRVDDDEIAKDTSSSSSSIITVDRVGAPMALILAPARELAYQIHSVCRTYSQPLGFRYVQIICKKNCKQKVSEAL